MNRNEVRWRAVYVAATVLLLGGSFLAQIVEARIYGQLHTIIEVLASALSLVCGTIALLRYYARRDADFLLLGAALAGTAALEAVHVLVGTQGVATGFASAFTSVSPWSWFAARFFLAAVLLSSGLPSIRQRVRRIVEERREWTVYLWIATIVISTFLVFALVELPEAYHPAALIPRWGELLPGITFLAALVLFLRSGRWKQGGFEAWLVLAMIVWTAGQLFYIALSSRLYGIYFYSGHVLKLLGFGFVFVGIMIEVYRVFRRAEEAVENLSLFSSILQDLHGVTTGMWQDYDELFTRFLRIGRQALELDTGIITEIRDGRWIARAVDSTMGFRSGDELALDETICAAVIERREPVSVPDVAKEERFATLAPVVESGVESYIGAPIVANRDVYGTLCFSSSAARLDRGFTENERDVVDVMAQTVGRLIERERAERALEEERAKVDRLKDEFVSVVSHELRTPLTAIRGSLGLLAGGATGTLPEKAQRMVDIAAENTDRLVRLVNDILDIEKMRSGTLSLERRPSELHELIHRAVEVMRALGVERSVRIETEAQAHSSFVDPDRISQALTNLLSNALKYSPVEGTVRVRGVLTGGTYRITVSDEGRGVPADKLEAIFDRFQQVDSSDAREKGGTGLGLAISKAIVEQHNGEIGVESSVGDGSTFWIELPAAASSTGGNDA